MALVSSHSCDDLFDRNHKEGDFEGTVLISRRPSSALVAFSASDSSPEKGRLEAVVDPIMAFDQSLIHLRPRPLCQAPDVDPPLYFCHCISTPPLTPPSYAPDDAASATFAPLGLLHQTIMSIRLPFSIQKATVEKWIDGRERRFDHVLVPFTESDHLQSVTSEEQKLHLSPGWPM
ncbi:hypothetical protein L2E82_42578 [Cichorium intybus]|uniref:Uncharacterized protein n=1 Tax=Cichorium intybus TaxID=13427 RepID=A0ACB8ZLB0_CICIN|nr:hypothetical protein L2E82_42578 [Cichorium intybus]